ncbi:hypothetical protein L1049_009146 [Liquidambar formosana]|uniref:Uncharacterized protein n=1 Tax=Liquidambar formosana TaxID=63359 RepID=A0AAP0X9S9_LIQFO
MAGDLRFAIAIVGLEGEMGWGLGWERKGFLRSTVVENTVDFTDGKGIDAERKEEREYEVRSVGVIPGGEVGLGDDRHAKPLREAASSVGGVGALEVEMVELLDPELVRLGVVVYEVGESH